MKSKMGTGDSGETDVPGGRRVGKDSRLVDALGAIDEAAAAIGLARSFVKDAGRKRLLLDCQEALGAVAAEVAAAGTTRTADFDFRGAVAAMEGWMKDLSAIVPRAKGFITPGEEPAEAALNLARTLVRRAERAAVSLRAAGKEFEPAAAVYLNRLSDLLFELVRAEVEGK